MFHYFYLTGIQLYMTTNIAQFKRPVKILNTHTTLSKFS